MAEYTNSGTITVSAGQNVPLTETVVSGSGCIMHRDGSGIVTLRGATSQCRALYRVSFGANIAVATGGTAEAISVALALNGEPLSTAVGTVTPTAVGNFGNIFVSAIVAVPRGCCVTIAAENEATQAVDVSGAALIAERIA